jgi:hypothetical protein
MQVWVTNLPDLAWQWAYARMGWGIVGAALVLRLWPRPTEVTVAVTAGVTAGVTASVKAGVTDGWTPGVAAGITVAPMMPGAASALAALAALAMWLPHGASPAYWLGLALQQPSPMLVALCALALLARCTRLRAPPPPGPGSALVLAAGGLLLYADSSGWLSLGLYLRGADPLWAPLGALLAGAWAVRAVRYEATRSAALMLIAATTVFCLTRLPSGNVFDAFLDPLLWMLCMGIGLKAGVQRWRSAVRARPGRV